jgi:hypothetical protein
MGAATIILDIGDTFDVIGWLTIIAFATFALLGIYWARHKEKR